MSPAEGVGRAPRSGAAHATQPEDDRKGTERTGRPRCRVRHARTAAVSTTAKALAMATMGRHSQLPGAEMPDAGPDQERVIPEVPGSPELRVESQCLAEQRGLQDGQHPDHEVVGSLAVATRSSSPAQGECPNRTWA